MSTRYAVGGLPLPSARHVSIGPRHPSEAGVIAILCNITDERIVIDADVQPGFLHRSAEKLFEVRDYRSLVMLADRHDWLASSSGELSVTLAVENAMRLAPPPRATHLRTVLAEYARIHSHLSHLSHVADGATAAGLWDAVDDLRAGLLEWSGNRVHPMLNRVGGLAVDVPDGWLDTVRRRVPLWLDLAARLEAAAWGAQHLAGLAVADRDVCRAYALTGPTARAAGLDLDRRRRGYLAYGDVFEPAAPIHSGDAQARLVMLAREVATSARMIERLTASVPPGPVDTRLSRRLKVPEGEFWVEVEAPWGVAGVMLTSRGGQTPWRLALRTPTFANVSALAALLVGAHEDQMADVVASVGYAIGDLDK